MDLLENISKSVIAGDNDMASEMTKLAIEQNISAKTILDDGLINGMNTVGEKFKTHEFFLPDVLMAAKALQAGMDLLKPLLIKQDVPSRGKIIIGTVRGDLHDIGKNLVGIMLKGAGFDVFDLGNDVPPERFIEKAKEENATIIGMSALLITTMPVMKEVIDLIKKENLAGKILTIVGGAPVSKAYAEEIGASAYSYDGSHAIECVEELINK